MKSGGEQFQRYAVASLFLHGGGFLLLLFAPSVFPVSSDSPWGTNNGGNGGIDVHIVSSVAGINLPSPAVVRENAAANDSSGLYASEPAPKVAPPPPDETAVQIPTKEAPRQPKPVAAPVVRNSAAVPADTPPPPANAVPFGEGGRPALAYGQAGTGGPAGVSGFGDGAFGTQFGAYVQAMTRKISESWLKATVDGTVKTAPRVYLTFTIARDGRVSDVTVDQTSGVPSLDRSAMSAILRASPLPSLPAEYRGTTVSVRFYFDYVR